MLSIALFSVFGNSIKHIFVVSDYIAKNVIFIS